MPNIVKNTSGTDLTLGPSWLGGTAPTSTDVAVWVGGSLGGSLTLPASRSWQGINVSAAPTSAISVTGAGTLTVGVNGVIVDTTALNVTWATPVSLGNSQTWSVGSGRQLTFSGIVSGTSVTLTLSGVGTTYLQGTNTYSGTTSISNGLVLAENSGFGTSAVSMTGGTISSPDANPRSYTNALTLNSTVGLSFSASNGALTFSGTTTLAGPTTLTNPSTVTLSGQLTGTGTLTKSGAGDLVLTGSGNTNSGNVTLSAGNTQLASLNSGTPNQLNGVTTVTLAGGTIFYRGNTATTIGHALTGSTGGEVYVRNTSATGVTFSGSWSGLQRPVNIYADASEGGATAQTLTLSTNTATAFTYLLMNNQSSVTVNQTLKYTGTSTWTCGQNLLLFRLAAAGIRGILHNASSGNITWSGLVRNEVAFPVTFEIKNDSSGVTTISGNITQASSGALAVEKTGSGTATLTGNNAFTNPCNVLAGTLNANSATALGAASSTTAISVTGGATLSLGAALNYSSPGRSTSIGGYGVGFSGALIHAFAGTANIGTISCGSTTYIRATQTGTLSSGVVTSGVSDVFVGVDSSKTLTLSGGISGTGRLVVGYSVSDAGTVYLSTSNSYAGVTSLQYGTLLLGNNNALGTSGGLTFDGNATIDAATSVAVPLTYMTVGANITFGGTADLTLYGDFDLNAASRTITTNGTVGLFTLFGTISGASRKLVKAGGNRLKLAPTNGNTYTGGTDITAGTLQAAHVTALGTTGTVTLTASGATLQTLTTGGQNGKLTVAALTNSAGGTIKIGG